MKAKFNINGWLQLERAGKYKQQACPHNNDSVCGDWCPMLQEENIPFGSGKGVSATCGSLSAYELVSDERPAQTQTENETNRG